MKQLTTRLWVAAWMGMMSLPAFANNFNYNQFEIRVGSSPGTLGAELMTYFTENTHFVGRFDSQFSGDWDLAAGMGFQGPIGQFADIYGEFLVHNIKTDWEEVAGEDFASEFNIGTRLWITQVFDANLRLGKMFYDSDDERSIFALDGRFHSSDQLIVGAGFRDYGVYDNQFVMFVNFTF